MSPITLSKHNYIKVVYKHRAKRLFKSKITVLLRSDQEYNKEKTSFLRIRKLKNKIKHITPAITTNEISKPLIHNEFPIINTISNTTEIEKKELSHQEVLDKILKENPEMNIISRKGTYLVRVKVKSSTFMKRFDSLKEAETIRNKMLLLSMKDDPKYYIHMMRRLAISKNNKQK